MFSLNTQVCEDEELSRVIVASRLARAGLVGIYAEADCPEGHASFQRAEQGQGSYLWGLPGRGKTYAAACCVRLALGRDRKVRLVTAKRLLDEVRAGFDGEDPDALKRAEQYDLLVLDDLGAERPTEWTLEVLTGLIDHRISFGLPTVITSNFSLGQLSERYGGMPGMRIASRIGGGCKPIEMTGADRRLSA